ncbi:MAG: N-acetyltransferase [Bacteroidetes bacterium]|nr:MAG: N-acetyltransferase [Bacteroidota bacterium]
MLHGKKIFLRAVTPSDADILYKWENDKSNWQVSGTKKPFTKKEIKEFIANQKDIYLDKQLRLMIETRDKGHGTGKILNPKSQILNSVGCIDLFNFSERKQNAGVGILVDKTFRKKGYASEALSLLIKYTFNTLNLRELFCSVSEDNKASVRLFQKHKFKIIEKNKNVCSLKLAYK